MSDIMDKETERLMNKSDSFDNVERGYWKMIWKDMSHNDRFRFVEILTTEERKLSDLEIDYQISIIKENEEILAKYR